MRRTASGSEKVTISTCWSSAMMSMASAVASAVVAPVAPRVWFPFTSRVVVFWGRARYIMRGARHSWTCRVDISTKRSSRFCQVQNQLTMTGRRKQPQKVTERSCQKGPVSRSHLTAPLPPHLKRHPTPPRASRRWTITERNEDAEEDINGRGADNDTPPTPGGKQASFGFPPPRPSQKK